MVDFAVSRQEGATLVFTFQVSPEQAKGYESSFVEDGAKDGVRVSITDRNTVGSVASRTLQIALLADWVDAHPCVGTAPGEFTIGNLKRAMLGHGPNECVRLNHDGRGVVVIDCSWLKGFYTR